MSDPQPAFPAPFDTPYYGLTKRELFAAMAMQGLAPRMVAPDLTADITAALAVQWADALIAALNRKEKDA